MALTGEMSGQDVTKQLALVEYVNGENVELNCNIVSMTERIEILKNFLETIPEGMRKPIEEVKPKVLISENSLGIISFIYKKSFKTIKVKIFKNGFAGL